MNVHLITKLTMTNKKRTKTKTEKTNLVKKLRITPPNMKTENHFLKKKNNEKTKKHQKKKRKKKETEGIPRPFETSQKRFHKTYYFRFLTCKFPLYDDGSPSKHLPPFTMPSN